MQIKRYDILCMLLWGCALFALSFGIQRLRSEKKQPLCSVRSAALLVFCCCCASILYLTGMFTFLTDPQRITLRCPFTGFDLTPFRGHVYLPILQNYLLFLPFGFLLPSVTPKIRWNLFRAAFCGLVISLCIELLQAMIGRRQEIDDLICNTAGTAAGFLAWAALFRKGRKPWQRILILAGTALLSCLMLYGIRQLCR